MTVVARVDLLDLSYCSYAVPGGGISSLDTQNPMYLDYGLYGTPFGGNNPTVGPTFTQSPSFTQASSTGIAAATAIIKAFSNSQVTTILKFMPKLAVVNQLSTPGGTKSVTTTYVDLQASSLILSKTVQDTRALLQLQSIVLSSYFLKISNTLVNQSLLTVKSVPKFWAYVQASSNNLLYITGYIRLFFNSQAESSNFNLSVSLVKNVVQPSGYGVAKSVATIVRIQQGCFNATSHLLKTLIGFSGPTTLTLTKGRLAYVFSIQASQTAIGKILSSTIKAVQNQNISVSKTQNLVRLISLVQVSGSQLSKSLSKLISYLQSSVNQFVKSRAMLMSFVQSSAVGLQKGRVIIARLTQVATPSVLFRMMFGVTVVPPRPPTRVLRNPTNIVEVKKQSDHNPGRPIIYKRRP